MGREEDKSSKDAGVIFKYSKLIIFCMLYLLHNCGGLMISSKGINFFNCLVVTGARAKWICHLIAQAQVAFNIFIPL